MPSIDLASDVRHDRLEQVARRSFSTAAELLSFDRDDSLQAEERWSPGKAALFVVASCGRSGPS